VSAWARHLVRLTSYASWPLSQGTIVPGTVSAKFDVGNSQATVSAAAPVSGSRRPSRNTTVCIATVSMHPEDTKSGSFDMSEIIKSERISRCKALRLLRLTVAFVVATSAGVVISASTAGAGETSGHVRRASCTLVRYYVARYSAPAAEAWARSKGATDAEINTARRCITSQRTAQVSHIVE
jgi:hypothetical protein